MPGVRLNRRRFIAAATGMVSAAAARSAMAEAETLAADPAAVQKAQPEAVQEARPPGQTLASPKGKVILSISGRISVTNTASAARFDREMLEDLGLAKFTTMTPWYNEPVTFEGVRLDRLMQVVGASGEQLRARALDDYTTEIPIADFEPAIGDRDEKSRTRLSVVADVREFLKHRRLAGRERQSSLDVRVSILRCIGTKCQN